MQKGPQGAFWRASTLSAFEVGNLAFFAIPLCRIRHRVFALSDIRPDFRQLNVQLNKFLHLCRDFVLGENSDGRAFWFTQGAVNALVRVDDQEIRAFVEAVHRTHFYAVGVLALDAVVGDDEGGGSETLCGRAREVRER
eukprot:gene6113-7081_t